jgi:uncharacterized protein (TIGR03437 family)
VLAGLLSLHAQSSRPFLDYSTFLGSASGALYVGADREGSAYVAGIAYWQAPPYVEVPFHCDFTLTGLETQSPFGYLSKILSDGSSSAWTLCFPDPPAGLAVLPSGTIYFATADDQLSKLFRIDAGPQPFAVPIAVLESASVRSVAVDARGSIYLGGSALPGFQTTDQAYRAGPRDDCPAPPGGLGCSSGFVAKLDPARQKLWSTFTGLGRVSALAPDSRGALWITGFTELTGGSTGFIAKFDPNGANRTFFEAFGGGSENLSNAVDAGVGVTVDAHDAAYITGRNSSGLQRVLGEYGRFVFTSYTNWLKKVAPDGGTLWTSTDAFKNVRALSMPIAVNDSTGSLYVGSARLLSIFGIDSGALITSRRAPMPIESLAAGPPGRFYVCGGGNYGAFVATPGAWITQYPGGSWSGYAARFDPAHPASFEVTSLVNAASFGTGFGTYVDGSVAPGELVTLFGEGFEPGQGLEVTLAGRTAHIIFANSKQINAVVPFGIEPGTLAVLSVRSGGQTIKVFELPVRSLSPGVFAPVLNDDWSLNSEANPADRGSIVTFFMTGLGPYDLPIDDGSPGPLFPPFPSAHYQVTAVIGNQNAEVLFAGQAPGLVAGVVQVNVRIPSSLPQPGTYHISVTVGPVFVREGQYADRSLRVHVR